MSPSDEDSGEKYSSDYVDVCKYTCPVCGKPVERLKIHMVGNHSHMDNFEDFEYKDQDFDQKTYHKCGICGKVILFTRVNIRNHAVNDHKLTIQEYNDKFMKLKRSDKVCVKKKQRQSSCVLGEDIEVYDEKEHESLLSNDYRDVVKVGCKICGKDIDKDLISTHLNKKHKLTFAEYEPKYGTPEVTNLSFHKCGVCGKIFIFSRVRLNGHVTHKHKMTLKEYGAKYMKHIKTGTKLEVTDEELDEDVMYSNDYEDECKTVCKICSKVLSYGNLASHAFQCHKLRTADYIRQFGKVEMTKKSYHECAVCHKTLLFVRYHIAQHVKGKHGLSLREYNRDHMQFHNVEYSDQSPRERGRKIGTQKAPMWCDGTMFKCPYCQNIYYRYFTFRIHLLRSHEVRDSEERGKVVRENEMMTDTYQCKICNQSMKRDRMDIEAHVKQVHKTTLRIYEANFENAAGDSIDPIEVLGKLISDGLVQNESATRKGRKRRRDFGETFIFKRNVNRIKVEDLKKEIELKEEVDEIKQEEFEMPKKRIRRAPAKFLDQEFEFGGNSYSDISNGPAEVKLNKSPSKTASKFRKPCRTPQKIKVKESTEPVKTEIKSDPTTPMKSSINFTHPKPVKTPIQKKKITEKFIVSPSMLKNSPTKPKLEPITPNKHPPPKNPQTQKTTFISVGTSSPGKSTPPTSQLLEPKKEVEEEVIYQCPMPECHWTCTREGMRQGPAVLHLLRIHKIQPVEMRERGIKFEKL